MLTTVRYRPSLTFWQVVGAGDFNGDGKADVLWHNASTGENYLWLMNGLSVIGSGPLPTVPILNWQIVGIGDFNGDGKADILWRNSVTGENYMWLMNGFSIVGQGPLALIADLNWQVFDVATQSASSFMTPVSSTALLGDQNVENLVSFLPLGQAQAFRVTANTSGAVHSLVVYLDSTSTVSQLVVGIYADAGGHPGTLLTEGSSAQLRPGVWNSIAVPPTKLTAGAAYWIALLGTGIGTPAVRAGTVICGSEASAQTQLTTLPSSWVTGAITSICPVSAFGDAGKVFFFDNFPGTQLSADWTVISRHGEYSQDETECNIPQQVAVGNVLTITTAAQTWICGDFYPDGTVFHAPSPWPYITGDIQWTSLNFSGTVEIRAKFPDEQTSLWPATWLLGSNCQATNPFTGETGVGSCPALGSSGYTEIDMTECYGSGWCQFHVANPSFGIGNGCDGTYTVDSNWHTFKTVWNSTGITQYIDGAPATTCQQQLSNPMFLLIQTQTGGVGRTPNNGVLPATLAVDYVKVTQP